MLVDPAFWEGVCEPLADGNARCGGEAGDVPAEGAPGATPADPGPQITPQELVERLVAQLPLPAPDPHIGPGYMITGMRAYLETGGTTTHEFDPLDTPLGTLTLTARGSFVVDWGDGTVTGPHRSVGGPYPHGDIVHVYQHSGNYRITVAQDWNADWALAGESGTVTGLRTVGAIDDFAVEQVQAVRER